MGESFGSFIKGNDQAIFPYIHACNIACGFHGGDPWHIEQTIKTAIQHQLTLGAHPSYPDLAGFGRRPMALSSEELYTVIKYQIAALKGMVESHQQQLVYVKPHGALYNEMAKNHDKAIPVIQAIKAIDSTLALMGLANSPLEDWAVTAGVTFISEAFIDRAYTSTGQLVSRKEPNAVIHDPVQAWEQLQSIFYHQTVQSNTGTSVHIKADSFCIHGDNPNAVAILSYIHSQLAG